MNMPLTYLSIFVSLCFYLLVTWISQTGHAQVYAVSGPDDLRRGWSAKLELGTFRSRTEAKKYHVARAQEDVMYRGIRTVLILHDHILGAARP